MVSQQVFGLLASTDAIQFTALRILQTLTGKTVEEIERTNAFSAWVGRLDQYIQKTREIYARNTGDGDSAYEITFGYKYSEFEDGSIDRDEDIVLYLIRGETPLNKKTPILGSVLYTLLQPYGINYPSMLTDYQRPTVMEKILDGLLYSVIPKTQMLTFSPAEHPKPSKYINLGPVDPAHPLMQRDATVTYLEDYPNAGGHTAAATSAATIAAYDWTPPPVSEDSVMSQHQDSHQHTHQEIKEDPVNTARTVGGNTTRRSDIAHVPSFLHNDGEPQSVIPFFAFNPPKHHVLGQKPLKDILSARAVIVSSKENHIAEQFFSGNHATEYLIGYSTDVITDPVIVVAWRTEAARGEGDQDIESPALTLESVNNYYVIRVHQEKTGLDAPASKQ